ncbi:MAG: hypothetical protein ACSLFQ_02580 [Thermoanaerobaculia bacterium]
MYFSQQQRTPLRLAAIAILVAALPVLLDAQQPVQPVLEISGALSNPTPVHGETVRLDVSVVNRGPGGIHYVTFGLKMEGGLIVAVRCGGTPSGRYQTEVLCGHGAMAAGERVEASFDIQVGNSATALVVDGEIITYASGKRAEHSTAATSFRIDAPIARAAAVADLALTASEEPNPIPPGSPVTYTTTVTNLGPDDATGLEVVSVDPFIGGPAVLSNVSGASCTPVEFLTVCRVESLAAGSQATIRYTRDGFNYPTQAPRAVFVIAENSYDPDGSNSSLERQVLFGLPAELTRVLLPIVVPVVEGAYGSRWVSELSLFVDGEADLFVFPTVYDCRVLCPPIPLSGEMVPPHRLVRPLLVRDFDRVGYLLRFDRSRAHEVAFTARIRDESRALETWGTAVPVVTDDELVRGRLQLIDIAAGPRFRQTLRVYEPDATGASVRVRVYGDTGTETLLGEETLVLATPPHNQQPDSNAGLPVSPGYAQLDFLTRFPTTTQYPRLRVEIEPLTSATRYWALVSITNNETQHVTLVTPETGGTP